MNWLLSVTEAILHSEFSRVHTCLESDSQAAVFIFLMTTTKMRSHGAVR